MFVCQMSQVSSATLVGQQRTSTTKVDCGVKLKSPAYNLGARISADTQRLFVGSTTKERFFRGRGQLLTLLQTSWLIFLLSELRTPPRRFAVASPLTYFSQMRSPFYRIERNDIHDELPGSEFATAVEG
jgi:hypothetical protein